MTKIIFNKSHKIIAAVMALVLCFSAFLWIAPEVQSEELDISNTSVTGFTTPGTPPTITNGNLTGGSIGVFVTSTTGDRYRADNIKWTYNNGDWEFGGDTKVLFENNGEKQQIAAYYPYTETTNGSVAITLPEAYDANYDQYDYLYGEYHPLNSNPAIIRMEHLMAKVAVNVQDWGTELAGDDVKSIAIADVPRTATWTLPGDTLSEYGDGESIDLYGNGSSYTGYALPNGAEDLTLRITMESGRIFTATASLDDLTTADKTESLEGGVHYRIGVKLGKDKVDITAINVIPWAQEDLDGGVASLWLPNYVDATAMTHEQLYQAVTQMLEFGHSDLEVTLESVPEVKKFLAIRNALLDADLVSGPVSLTIKGATVIPEYVNGDIPGVFASSVLGRVLPIAAISLPDAISIGKSAFSNLVDLESFSAPFATTVGDRAFERSGLKDVDLPNVETVGNYAFSRCSDLSRLSLPSAKTVGEFAFLDCSSLSEVDLPAATDVGAYVFQNCWSLQQIVFGNLEAVNHFSYGIFNGGADPSGITLRLSPEQKVMVKGEDQYWRSTTTPYRNSADHAARSFLGFTFKEIKFAE
ncbi:MAG: fimbrillin family protein [Clostridia bacterium]|nr:fimbrillin family protein [Clostridia bacterium]